MTLIREALLSRRPQLPWELFLVNVCLFAMCVRDWKGLNDYAFAAFAVASTVYFLVRHVHRKRDWQRVIDDYDSLARKGAFS